MGRNLRGSFAVFNWSSMMVLRRKEEGRKDGWMDGPSTLIDRDCQIINREINRRMDGWIDRMIDL